MLRSLCYDVDQSLVGESQRLVALEQKIASYLLNIDATEGNHVVHCYRRKVGGKMKRFPQLAVTIVAYIFPPGWFEDFLQQTTLVEMREPWTSNFKPRCM